MLGREDHTTAGVEAAHDLSPLSKKARLLPASWQQPATGDVTHVSDTYQEHMASNDASPKQASGHDDITSPELSPEQASIALTHSRLMLACPKQCLQKTRTKGLRCL